MHLNRRRILTITGLNTDLSFRSNTTLRAFRCAELAGAFGRARSSSFPTPSGSPDLARRLLPNFLPFRTSLPSALLSAPPSSLFKSSLGCRVLLFTAGTTAAAFRVLELIRGPLLRTGVSCGALPRGGSSEPERATNGRVRTVRTETTLERDGGALFWAPVAGGGGEAAGRFAHTGPFEGGLLRVGTLPNWSWA